MSDIIKVDVVDVVDVPSVAVVDDKPLTGLKLYNSFKKSLPKGLGKDIVASRWIEYKIMLGLPIVEKVVKVKKEKVVKVKKEKVKKVKKSIDDSFNTMLGDFNIGNPQMLECSA